MESYWYEFSETAEEGVFNILNNNKFLGYAELLDNNVTFSLKEENNDFRREITNKSFKWKIFIIDTKTFEITF